MYYVIYAEDTPNSFEKRRSVRAAHLQRLESLKEEGRLIVAGPLLADDDESPTVSHVKGSLIIADFDNLEAAKAWAASDPFVTADVYANVTIQAFKKTL